MQDACHPDLTIERLSVEKSSSIKSIMSLITANNLSKSFGAADIFSDVSLTISARGRVAIVGPNGIGKTTLLRVLAGDEPASSGQVQRARGLRLGYLAQEARFIDASNTLWDECLAAFDDVRDMEAEMLRLEELMSDPNEAEEAMERYGKIQARFDHRDGYTYQNRIEQVLTGLGFEETEFQDPLAHLSGGQRTRALLARLLLSEPDLLILDEPTNHLDIQAVEWLEGYLSQWDGSVLIVSHDRYFLDRVANLIFEMSPGRCETYKGNYSAYLQQRQERWQRRVEVFEKEKERLEKEVEYIRRNIAGQNTLQAKGRLKRLTRYLQAIDQVGLEAAMSKNWAELSEDVVASTSPMGVEEAQRRVRGLSTPNNQPPNLHLRLKVDQRSGDIVMRAADLVVGYPGRVLFEVAEIELRRLECVALIGPNGAGKTTFLKTILEQIPPLAGTVSLGASLSVGYFAQAHEGLRPERSLIQEIESVAPNMLIYEIRDYLAKFLFSGDDVYKRVGVLSGGERGRLALAKLALSSANLLLLDEPSNHLDILSQEILQDVLASYQGTILLVSHDRYLIDALATQIWEIDENGDVLHIFKGSYSEYRLLREAEREAVKVKETQARADQPRPVAAKTQSSGAPAPRRSNNEERRRQKRIQDLEAKIEKKEAELADVEQQLASPPADSASVQKLGSDYVRLQQEIEALMHEWETLHLEE